MFSHFFFFNDTATTEIYTLSLHDALPICGLGIRGAFDEQSDQLVVEILGNANPQAVEVDNELRSEEHTSELQSLRHLVCRLLLEKKKKKQRTNKQYISTKHNSITTVDYVQ